MSTNQGLVALHLIMQSIATGDEKSLLKYLNLLPLSSMAIDKVDALLARLATTAVESNQSRMMRVLIDFFESNYTDRYVFPILNQILLDLRYEDDVVAFILAQYPERSYLELANNYVNGEVDDNVVTGLTRLENLRGPLTRDEYVILYDQSIGVDNYVTRDFFGYQLDQVSEYAPIPEWVHNFTDEELPRDDEIILPEVSPFVFQPPESVDDVIDILTEGLRVQGRSDHEVELARAELRKRLSGADKKEQMAMIRGILENKAIRELADNEDLFAVLGPANTILDDDLVNDKSLCRKYGGCRMFYCVEFEDFLDPSQGEIIYPPDQYKPTDWFTGSCQVCHLKIRRYPHAIRLPLDHGGWKGCYCSEKCLRQDSTDNPLVSSNIDVMLDQLKRIGIQDRLPSMK